MEIITLHNVLPDVFADEPSRASDVWRCSLTLHKGERYLIEAASGTGKSSFCSYLFGARTDYQGVICYDGADIRAFSVKQWVDIRCRHLAYLPQGLGLFPELTVRENIMLKNRLTHYMTMAEIEARLSQLELMQKIDTPVGLLSIGQQQRIALLRALCQPFDFIMLDEPVSHLDAANNLIAADMVQCEAQRQGAGIILTSVGNPLAIKSPITLNL